jgi:CBS domain-containing protein
MAHDIARVTGQAAVPASHVLDSLRDELAPYPPFDAMHANVIDRLLTASTIRYFAPGEGIFAPSDGPVRELCCVRSGTVTAAYGDGVTATNYAYEAGELFPVGAALSGRAVTGRYVAADDVFLLSIPSAAMQEAATSSSAFADFLQGRVARILEQSRKALQAAYATRTFAEGSLDTPLDAMMRTQPLKCSKEAPLHTAIEAMHRHKAGSVVVVGEAGEPVGILTRGDVIGRVVLPGMALEASVAEVMSTPVRSLDAAATLREALLLMGASGTRHVPVTRNGALAGIVSERDIFAAQRLGLQQVGLAVRSAFDTAALALAAHDIRALARNLLGQGVAAAQVTELISQLNDLVVDRAIGLAGARHPVRMDSACWLALGSEGRSEQTISTDQDNALLLPDDTTESGRKAWLDFGAQVNATLDACGYPLCKGGIMAGQPDCCLTLSEWRACFHRWIEQGSPHDLLQASIFFDLRPLVGATALALSLRREVLLEASRTPRFLKQLALNALDRSPALNWLGAIDADAHGGVDLKLRATAIFVDAGRIYALAHAIEDTSTAGRLRAAGRALRVPEREVQGWLSAFDFLQTLRLRRQLDASQGDEGPNWIALEPLGTIDRRILRESMRVARSLQQRIRLDYERG